MREFSSAEWWMMGLVGPVVILFLSISTMAAFVYSVTFIYERKEAVRNWLAVRKRKKESLEKLRYELSDFASTSEEKERQYLAREILNLVAYADEKKLSPEQASILSTIRNGYVGSIDPKYFD